MKPEFDEAIFKEYIEKKIEAIRPKYIYPTEQGGYNPAFQNISGDHYHCPLQENQKMIFVLRGDFILATGIKNSEIDSGNKPFELFSEEVQKNLERYLDSKDKYGHPSLAVPEGKYDGSVYYAGWFSQRKGYLQIFLVSGRFFRTLSEYERTIIESYIAKKFMYAYGEQMVRFYDYMGDQAHGGEIGFKKKKKFFHNEELGESYREYDSFKIASIAKELEIKKRLEKIKKINLTAQYTKMSKNIGSNEGGFFRSKENGKTYYIKYLKSGTEKELKNTKYRYRNINRFNVEFLSLKLYEMFGVAVPNAELVTLEEKGVLYIGIASEKQEEITPVDLADGKATGEFKAKVQEDFLIDVLLGAYDVVGTGKGTQLNLYIKNGKPFRLDAGGTMFYTGTGKARKKDGKGIGFAKEAREFEEMAEGHNQYTGLNEGAIKNANKFFKGIYDSPALVVSLRKLMSISDKAILECVQQYGFYDSSKTERLCGILLDRRKNLIVKAEEKILQCLIKEAKSDVLVKDIEKHHEAFVKYLLSDKSVAVTLSYTDLFLIKAMITFNLLYATEDLVKCNEWIAHAKFDEVHINNVQKFSEIFKKWLLTKTSSSEVIPQTLKDEKFGSKEISQEISSSEIKQSPDTLPSLVDVPYDLKPLPFAPGPTQSGHAAPGRLYDFSKSFEEAKINFETETESLSTAIAKLTSTKIDSQGIHYPCSCNGPYHGLLVAKFSNIVACQMLENKDMNKKINAAIDKLDSEAQDFLRKDNYKNYKKIVEFMALLHDTGRPSDGLDQWDPSNEINVEKNMQVLLATTTLSKTAIASIMTEVCDGMKTKGDKTATKGFLFGCPMGAGDSLHSGHAFHGGVWDQRKFNSKYVRVYVQNPEFQKDFDAIAKEVGNFVKVPSEENGGGLAAVKDYLVWHENNGDGPSIIKSDYAAIIQKEFSSLNPKDFPMLCAHFALQPEAKEEAKVEENLETKEKTSTTTIASLAKSLKNSKEAILETKAEVKSEVKVKTKMELDSSISLTVSPQVVTAAKQILKHYDFLLKPSALDKDYMPQLKQVLNKIAAMDVKEKVSVTKPEEQDAKENQLSPEDASLLSPFRFIKYINAVLKPTYKPGVNDTYAQAYDLLEKLCPLNGFVAMVITPEMAYSLYAEVNVKGKEAAILGQDVVKRPEKLEKALAALGVQCPVVNFVHKGYRIIVPASQRDYVLATAHKHSIKTAAAILAALRDAKATKEKEPGVTPKTVKEHLLFRLKQLLIRDYPVAELQTLQLIFQKAKDDKSSVVAAFNVPTGKGTKFFGHNPKEGTGTYKQALAEIQKSIDKTLKAGSEKDEEKEKEKEKAKGHSLGSSK